MADRYWVGGSASWDAVAGLKWSLTSGGLGGQSVPTAEDDVYIDSGSGVVTVTATSASVSRSLLFISGSGSFAGTFAGTSGITVAGSLTLSASMTRTFTGGITFTATSAQTITPNGISLDSSLIFNGVGGAWQLANNLVSAVVIPSTRAVTLTNGTLDLNNNVLTTAIFSSTNSNTRSIIFGTGKIVLIGSGTVIADTTTQTGFTYTGSGLIESTYSGSTGTRTFNLGRTTGATESNALSLSITAGSDSITLNNTQQLKNLTFSGFTGTLTNQNRTIFGNLTLSSGMTCTAGTSATTFAATSGTQQITTNNVALDFPITQNGIGGTVQLQDNLTMGSTRTYTLTNGALDLVSRTLSTGRFNCSTSSTTRSVAFGTGNITLTDFNATILLWGNFNLTATGSKNIFATYAGGTGTRTFSMNSTGAVETNVPNILITAGTDTISSIARVRTLNFTGFTGTYNSATSKSIFGGLIFDPGMTITGSANSHGFAATTGPFMIRTAGLVMDFPISFAGAAIGGIFEFDDAITMGAGRTLTANAGTVKFKAGATNTSGTFAFAGTSAPGRQVFIQSTTPGTQYTLSQPSGTVTAQFTTIEDCNATGGATWNAFVDSGNIDAGNVDGWDFGISPVVGGAEYTYALRSFTELRRF